VQKMLWSTSEICKSLLCCMVPGLGSDQV
jgi:hypothetical protein